MSNVSRRGPEIPTLFTFLKRELANKPYGVIDNLGDGPNDIRKRVAFYGPPWGKVVATLWEDSNKIEIDDEEAVETISTIVKRYEAKYGKTITISLPPIQGFIVR